MTPAAADPIPMQTLTFRALGTDVLVLSPAAEARAAAIQALVERYEARFSRFRPESEVSRLSQRAGRTVRVSPDLYDLVVESRRWWETTGGVFDPLVLPALEREGYDRSFDELPADRPAAGAQLAAPAHTFAGVLLDEGRRTVTLPPGARFDPGGIGKGWILDRTAEYLRRCGPFLVDMGGDIRAEGDGPDGEGWLVAVAEPFYPDEDAAWLQLRDAAVATSTTVRRRWQRDGLWRHHLIDTRTRRSSESDVVQATVIAAGGVEADVCAKTALLMGAEAGPAWLQSRRLEGMLITSRGEVIRTPGWAQHEQPVVR